MALFGCAAEATDDHGEPAASGDPGQMATAPGLVSRIEVVNGWLSKDDSLIVRWTMTNEGSETISLSRWQAPSASLEENVFDITLDGKPVRYVGKLVKRPEPTVDDFIPIEPGESITATIDLSPYYKLGHVGTYAIAYQALPLTILEAETPYTEALRSNTVTALRAVATADADVPKVVNLPQQDVLGAGFRNCSASQKSKIRTAFSQAENYARNAATYFSNGLHATRYKTWFGTYTSGRLSTVRSHYNTMIDAYANETFTFDCGCSDSAYAYVYPDDAYVIYLCNAFWSAPNAGTDSRGGTIVHETSHFTVVAGTNDWTYGQSSCRSLATSQPARAIDNADSHEYFAENTPAQN